MNDQSLQQNGFTLVELLVATLIFSIIIVAIYNVFDLHNRMAARQEEKTAMQQELLSAISQIADDLRMCGYSTGGEKFGFMDATNQKILCARDRISSDQDQAVNATDATIIGYQLAPGDNTIQKYYVDAGTVKWRRTAERISALNFTYFREDGAQITNPETALQDIRMVEISATAVPSPQREGLGIPNRAMTTRVQIRNIH